MGVGVSKWDNTPLVTLCKERKDLIRAARDARYYLATAHALYFRSLVNFGNALNQFVENELIVIPFLSDDDDSSTDTSDSDSSSDDDSVSVSDFCNQSQSSDYRKISACNLRRCGKRRNLKSNLRNTEKASSVFDASRFVPVSIVGRDLQNHCSIDHTCMSSNDRQNKELNSPGAIKNPKVGSGFVDNELVSAPMEVPSHYAFFSEDREISSSLAPPQPSVPAWDFLDLFSATDYAYCDYHNAAGIDEAESLHWREVRKREGIPELEDESKQGTPVDEQPQMSKKNRRKVIKGSSDSTVAGEAAAAAAIGEAASMIDKAVQRIDTKEMNHVSCEKEEAKGISDAPSLISPKEKDSTLRECLAFTTDEDDSSGSMSSISLHKSSSKGLRNAVNQIKNIAETAVGIGKRLSALFEVGRLPHQPLGAKFKCFVSWVLGSGNLTHKHLSRSNSCSIALPTFESIQEIGEESLSMKSGYLSSTLEKLYVWEKKLYEEVTVEEKLRVLYDKEYKILKNLDHKGAEPGKIEAVEASVRLLLSKMSVSVKAVDAVSRRIHKIRDEELVFQLFEIIHGLAEMWKFMGKCHRKQFWAIAGSKSCVHIIEPDSLKNSSLKATQKLEAEILKFEASFKNYVASQKAFVRLLNEWLIRGILNDNDEPAESPKSKTAPFSPSKIGAPEIFTACNDWWHEIEKAPETEVLRTIQELASRFRELEAMQVQEQQQRIRRKHTEKELAKQMRNFHEQWGKATPMSDLSEKMITDADAEGLVALREAMEEEKAKHENAIRNVNDTASACLQEGLAPVFEALKDFCVENVKAYQKIRIPKMV